MSIQRQYRHVGDLQVAIAATLQRPDGTAVSLSGKTPYFKMVDQAGTDKVALTSDNIVVDDAAAGQLHYNPQADDVDEEGTFYAYFVILSGSSYDTFPVEKGKFEIVIEDDS